MLNLSKIKNCVSKERKYYFERSLVITILFLLRKRISKKRFSRNLKVPVMWVHNGNKLSEKKITKLDLGYNLGQYSFTRKLYAKPEKFFKFKY